MNNLLLRRFFTVILFITVFPAAGQGNYAGGSKKLVGTIFKDKKDIPGLENYEFREGSLISAIDDPVAITVDVYQNGTTGIVFFSIMEDAGSGEYLIADVLEVKNIQSGWQMRTTFCRQNAIENPELVALVKSSTTEEFLKPVKQAWRFSRDKRRFEVISVKGIDCIGEGGS
ncbi:MAG: hypothetical protein C0490_03435 [Marivirga sp.]|nr:hypothetical protein [Marivirga sp.]